MKESHKKEKQQLLISKVMNKTKSQLNHQLSRAIQRSEKAYSEYIGEKKYYQAFRIKRANEVLYNLLEEYLFYCEKSRSEEHTSELQSRGHLVCRLLLEKKKKE